MKKKTMLVIGILGILLAVGAMSVAMVQNSSDEKTKDAQSHECTPEMMENMSENCPEQMMQSETHESMMNATHESSMMNNGSIEESTEEAGYDHCGDMDSDTDSTTGSSATATKAML